MQDFHRTDTTLLWLCTAAATELLRWKLYSLQELFRSAEEMDHCVVCHKAGNELMSTLSLGNLLMSNNPEARVRNVFTELTRHYCGSARRRPLNS